MGTLTFSRGTWTAKVSSYNLRSLLWAGGATASNKVIEALVGRFSRSKYITLEGYLMSMTRLHLAHGKFQIKLLSIIYQIEQRKLIKTKTYYCVCVCVCIFRTIS